MSERITEVSRGYQNDIRAINRDLMEKALHMRCLAYLSQAKSGLLTQTLFEMDRSKKELHGTYCRLSEEQAVIRRQKAELEAANRELRSFSYAVSHDLRAPLRAIHGFAHAIEDEGGSRLDGELRDYLQRIQAAAVRMGELIDDLLDFSRIGRAELRRGQVDMAGLVQEVLADTPQLAESISSGRIEVRLKSLPDALADRSLLWSFRDDLVNTPRSYACRRGRWKYLEIGGRKALYDLLADPGEQHDTAAQHPELARQLEKETLRLRRPED